ncbi:MULTISPECIES: M23 family metallopeptidase [unclassified Curtobacterium]|uniref:M23 family metallopeptidase n=1 Tax=unclassified Curtobacterium TaxID=257496 RepID=UPI00380A09DA
MPHASTSPLLTDRSGTDAPAPAVHLTRRARIEAERAAAKQDVQRVDQLGGTPVPTPPVGDQVVADQAAMPVTPPAPASPVLPASTLASETPPAPSSPDAAPAAARPAVRPEAARPVAAPVRPAAARSTPRGVRPEAARVDRATRHLGAGRATSRPAATAPARGSAFRRNASRVTALGALLFVAGLVVSTSLPAQALYTPEPGSTSNQGTTVAGETQSLRVGDAAEAETNRDAYTVSDATQYKNVDSSSFTNDPTGTIQWPFLTGVPITSGFGGRQVEGCSFCSTNHQGVDFAPGEGTPIRVIAAGTVTKVQADDGGFGNDVWVEHDVDGKQFTSVYGHMEDNSFKVVEGQHVEVGDELGLVGSTGNSTGPHLHLEVHVDGVPVDPLAWLKANAN